MMIRLFVRRLFAVCAVLIVQVVNLAIVPVNVRAATAMSPQELKAHCDEFHRKVNRAEEQSRRILESLDAPKPDYHKLKERLSRDEAAAHRYIQEHLEASQTLERRVQQDKSEVRNLELRSDRLQSSYHNLLDEKARLSVEYPECSTSEPAAPDPCESPTVFVQHLQLASRVARYGCGKSGRKPLHGQASVWSGTWTDGGAYTMQLSGSGNIIAYIYFKDNGQDKGRGTCSVHGSVATCKWRAHWHDDSVDIERTGTATLTMSGTSYAITVVEGTDSYNWHGGGACQKSPESCTGMHPGAKFFATYTRKK